MHLATTLVANWAKAKSKSHFNSTGHVVLTACSDVTAKNWNARGFFPDKSRGVFLTTPVVVFQ